MEVKTMNITKSLKKFLNISRDLSHSTILLTNLEHIICVSSLTNDDYYLQQKISNDLKQILKLYSSDASASQYLNTTMNRIIPIINNYVPNQYLSQIILPILQHEVLQGLLIFVSEDREYIASNLEFAKTTKHFVEILSLEDEK